MLPRFTVFLILVGLIGLFDRITHYPEISLPSKMALLSAFVSVPPNGIDSTWLVPTGLEQKLATCDLVLLGEAQHGDGATFARKADWVRYLHERFQFDVLLLESGIWAGVRLDLDLRAQQTQPEAICRHVWHFWATAAETASLWDYVANNGIKVGGFDLQFTGSSEDMASQFKQILQNAGQPETACPHTRHWLDSLDVFSLNGYHISPHLPVRHAIARELAALLDVLQTNDYPGAASDRLLTRNLLWNLEYWNLPDENRNAFRDSIMALNILEYRKTLLEHHRKIIIWAANAHILRQNPDDPIISFKTMGDFLNEQADLKCCTILFSSFNGQTRNIYNEQLQFINLYDAGTSSVEYALNSAGLKEGAYWIFSACPIPPGSNRGCSDMGTTCTPGRVRPMPCILFHK